MLEGLAGCWYTGSALGSILGCGLGCTCFGSGAGSFFGGGGVVFMAFISLFNCSISSIKTFKFLFIHSITKITKWDVQMIWKVITII